MSRHISFALSFLLSRASSSSLLAFLVLTQKKKMTASLPVIVFRVTEAYRKQLLEWLCHRGGIARLCLTPARWGCLMLNGHEIVHSGALHFVGLSLQKVPELLKRMKALYWVEELSLLEKKLIPSYFGVINVQEKAPLNGMKFYEVQLMVQETLLSWEESMRWWGAQQQPVQEHAACERKLH